jgi:hypothetical protein
MTSFHIFQKRPKNKYDGCDLLKNLGLDINYSASLFVWGNITVDMVPCGYWTKTKISTVAKTWNSNKSTQKQVEEELRLAKILPAEYKPKDITDIMQQQTHLTARERKQLLTVLFDLQDLFQGKCGNFNGEPITLELIPGSKPFYRKPFSIPKPYQQITKNEIAWLESLGVLTKVPSAK